MSSFFQPLKESFIFKILLAIALFLYSFITNAQVDKNSDLYKTLKSKDSIIFERAFNNCEIEKLESIILDDFEFYHDINGIQNKAGFITAIKMNLCTNPRNYTRQLITETLEVFPLKNENKLYGAIQKGKHTFQKKQNGKLITVGIADFTHLFILEKNSWKLKRVLSYNHKPYSE